MSRCFPFPPPGYENKARTDDLNLIIKEKEKHKHKKHKDKKDKDKKKERSERKDKERSEGKHEDDKEEHKQKKRRDKKDKKKDAQKSSEEKEIVGPSENQNGEKYGPDNRSVDGAHYCKFLVEMGKRVRDNDEATGKNDKKKKIVGPWENQNGEKPGPNNKPCDGDHNHRIPIDMGKGIRNDDVATDKKKKIVRPLEHQNGEKPGLDNKQCDVAHESRILAELGKRVRNDDVAKDHSHSLMANGQSPGKGSGNNWVGNFAEEKRIMVENGSCQVNKVEKRKDGKEKNENREKNRKEDKKRKKEEKKAKVKEKSKDKIKQRASEDNFLELCANKPEDLLKESWDRQGKLPKLKEPILNGFLHGNGTRPDNMSRPTISSQQVSRNGNCSHPFQKNTIPLTTDKQTVITNQTIDDKLSSSQSVLKNVRNMETGQTTNNFTPEHLGTRINNHAVSNGFISSNPLVENVRKKVIPNDADKTVDGPRPVFVGDTYNKEFGTSGIVEGTNDISSRASGKPPKEKDGAFVKKAPHPDLKYLSRILTVPELDLPRLDDDDQDWLFGSKDAKMPVLGPSESECTKQVWNEAIRFESVDITVLPYVVPY